MFGTAEFVSPSDETVTAPWIRGTFELHGTKSAKIRICGLGMFELYINGKRVGDDIFVPVFSMYEKRENRDVVYKIEQNFSYRTYVLEYDITEYVKDGINTICVLLGKGWYDCPGNYAEGCDAFGKVKLCYSISAFDGKSESVIKSDSGLKWAKSHIVKNDMIFGEEHDYTLYDENIFDAGFDDSLLSNVIPAKAPLAEYCIQDCPADKVTRRIKPRLYATVADTKIYDNGENITGWVVMKGGKSGEEIELYHTEDVNPDGTLNPDSFFGKSRPQREIYISDGKTPMHPHFCWHGFRYFSVKGSAEPSEVLVIHADVKLSCGFHSGNETLDWLFDAYVRTQTDNMHMGIPSDCPTREKLGYTGDGQLCCDAVMTMFDAKAFYRKWIRDIADSQDTVTGHVGHTAPFQGGGGGIGGWGSAIVEVPYTYYKHYGDIETLREFFPNMIRFMTYMDSRCECGIITGEEKGGWCLGDWGFPDKSSETLLPQNYVNTYFYIKCLDRMTEISALLGKKTLSESYAANAYDSRRVMKAAYMSPMTDDFCADVAGANCFAIDLGIGTQKTYKSMYDKYSKSKALDTGIFATDILIRLFFEKGNADLALELLTSHVENYSFGYMKDNGATTLWEYMTGDMSHNHPMFGAAVKTLFTEILGIKQTKGTAGFTSVELQPVTVKGLCSYEGYVTVPSGKITVSYERDDVHTLYKFNVPEGVSAIFRNECNTYCLKPGENVYDMQLFQ